MIPSNKICGTCLSQDRNLYHSKYVKGTHLIIPEITCSRYSMICWECKEQIRKYLKFKRQVWRAQCILTEQQQNSEIASISSLTIEKITSISVFDRNLIKFDPDTSAPSGLIENRLYKEELDIKEEPEWVDGLDNNEMEDPLRDDASVDDFEHVITANLVGKDYSDSIIPPLISEFTSSPILTVSDPVAVTPPLPRLDLPLVSRPVIPTVPLPVMTPNPLPVILLRPLTSQYNVKTEIKIPKTSDYIPTLDVKIDDVGKDKYLELVKKHSDIRMVTEEEMLEDREKNRKSKIYMRSRFKCELCIEYFSKEGTLANHMLNHGEPMGPFVCPVCRLRFSVKRALDQHYREHFRKFECRMCDYTCYDDTLISSHYDDFHRVNPVNCEDCDSKFQTKQEYLLHKRDKHKTRRCKFCDQSFATVYAWQQHNIKHHADRYVKGECNICHKTFEKKHGLLVHIKRAHTGDICAVDKDLTYCASCDTQFKTNLNYRTHMKYHAKHRTPDVCKHKCSCCDKQFVSLSLMKSHMEQHHDTAANYRCEQCSQSFKTNWSRRRHVRHVHDKATVKTRTLVCDICGKISNSKASLEQHINSHLGRRPYKCEICGDSFSFSGARYTHIKLKHKKNKTADKKAAKGK